MRESSVVVPVCTYSICIVFMLFNCILLNNMVVAITQEDLYLHDYCSTTLTTTTTTVQYNTVWLQ